MDTSWQKTLIPFVQLILSLSDFQIYTDSHGWKREPKLFQLTLGHHPSHAEKHVHLGNILQHYTQLHQSVLFLLHMFAASQHTQLISLHSHSGLSYRCGCAAGSRACWQRSRSPPARQVCGWWRSALTAGWSPPGWPTGWPHRCAGPTACCHPSFSGFLPEEERGIQTRCHADKLTISREGRCPQTNPSSFPFLSVLASFFLNEKAKLNPQSSLSCLLKRGIRLRGNVYLLEGVYALEIVYVWWECVSVRACLCVRVSESSVRA